jgi:hypothetical protein
VLTIDDKLKRRDRSQSAHEALQPITLSHELDVDERDNEHARDARTVPRITVCRIARRARSSKASAAELSVPDKSACQLQLANCKSLCCASTVGASDLVFKRLSLQDANDRANQPA